MQSLLETLRQTLRSRVPLDPALEDRLQRLTEMSPPATRNSHHRSRYVTVDVETTGADMHRDTLVSIGAVAIERGVIDLAGCFDLVVRQGGVVAFVEVKTRRGARFGPPAAAVGWRKRRELATGAAIWVARHGSPGLTYRFDVVGVSFFGTNVRIEYLVDAFGVENPRL